MCEYCEDMPTPLISNQETYIDVEKRGILYAKSGNNEDCIININYCPMCGKKLAQKEPTP